MAASAVAKPSAAASSTTPSSSHVHGHDEALPAPKSHLLLLFLSLAPAFLPIPANANIVATASLAVFVGCWRSVKQEAPTESMTRKVIDLNEGREKEREKAIDPDRTSAGKKGPSFVSASVVSSVVSPAKSHA